MVEFIRMKLNWPLGLKRSLWRYIRETNVNINDRLNHLANFVWDPHVNLVRTKHFRRLTSSIERNYGSAVSSIFHLQFIFFLLNIFTFILWLALIVLPYSLLIPSHSFTNISFDFSSIFTTRDYLSQSIVFQGNYRRDLLSKSYDLPLIYMLTSYLYYVVWFIFLTIRFASTYKRKIFHSILNSKLGLGFMCVFGRWNYATHSDRQKEKYQKTFRKEFRDLVENDERMKSDEVEIYQTWTYRLKMIAINLLFILFSILLGKKNFAKYENLHSSCFRGNQLGDFIRL